MMDEKELKSISDFPSLMQFLQDQFNWKFDSGRFDECFLEEATFSYSPEELNIDSRHAAKIKKILQLRPLVHEFPWGIFFMEFDSKKLPIGALRTILRALVRHKREKASRAHRPSWNMQELLFVCLHKLDHEKTFTFAHFKQPAPERAAKLTSFSWSPATHNRTVLEYNLPPFQWPTDTSNIEAWRNQWLKAFDKQKLTEEFYAEYGKINLSLENHLYDQFKDKKWSHEYALQFLNRCMFIYFVQKKRWLDGDPDFLESFWNAYLDSKHSPNAFFEKWLKVLFFKAFSKQSLKEYSYFPDIIYQALVKAPYLNGGLFSENDLDVTANRHHIKISDNQFADIIHFLERYNFTITEDTPLDQEVALNAEMLGSVYEMQISREERGDAGIVYTPRVEIDLMCRIALVDFLSNHLGDDHKFSIYEAVFAYSPDEKASSDHEFQKKNLWQQTYKLLSEITVLDPACGSGSFLVGMLQVLDDLTNRAQKALGKHESSYNRRKGIIGRSLYGIDVMRWAVEVAELRLWLQLIVESDLKPEDLQESPLLPNLTFKIRCGDSLIQEVGGVNISRRAGFSFIKDKTIRSNLEQLKISKLRFFNNDRSKSLDDLKSEEFYLFHQMLESQIDYLTRKKRSLMAKSTDDLFRPYQPDVIESSGGIYDKQIDEIEKTRNALKTVRDVPFVWEIAFVEIFEGEKEGFDIVIGNPPYVRQEMISNPMLSRDDVTLENRKAYKEKLIRSVYELYPEFFGKNSFKPEHRMNAKSDLYIYFYFHGLSLLNSRGSFCFITSNSWLDVGYGADLQEFLLKQAGMRMIIDNQAKRSFKQADVNTIIALLSPPGKKDEGKKMKDETARFVLFRVPFEQILSPVIFEEIEAATERKATPEYRIFPVAREKLFQDGCEVPEEEEDINKDRQDIQDNVKSFPSYASLLDSASVPLIKVARYIGNKWGGKYLRAPDIYWTILEKGKGKLVRLGDIAEVRFGIKTGANEFFYLDEGRIREWGIEGEFLKPVIKSPRECKRILIDPKDLKYKIFMCHKEKKDLRGTAALEYIKWGEKQKFHERPSCSGRARWWDVGERRIPKIISPSSVSEFPRTFENAGVFVDKRLYEIYPNNTKDLKAIHFATNAIICSVFQELGSRTGLGEGLLDLTVYELSDSYIINPIFLINFEQTLKNNRNRTLLPLHEEINHPDRRCLDAIIFDALGLTSGEREAVYEAVISLVEARLKKAQSV
ncbi:Eco57I restriction-modification methylase domain-containing protein [Candidatus Sumerlaeota bacterium]|nr:Eco57I restriction-modification methylase domain-containing protein [Candidatus Sumerlaeota bacterium]